MASEPTCSMRSIVARNGCDRTNRWHPTHQKTLALEHPMTKRETNSISSAKPEQSASSDPDVDGTGNDDYLEPDGDAPPKKRKSSFVDDMILVLLVAALLGAMLSTSFWIWVIRHWNDSPVPVPQGTVQRILFVGNVGIDTQIDTEYNSLLVRGMTQLRKGAHVETRKGPWAYELCDVDTGLCERLVRDE